MGLPGNENSTGNLLHFLLLLLCISVFFIRKDFRKQSYLVIYTFATIATGLIFCYLLKWQPWNSRLHLPLFVLTSPFIGLILSKILQQRMAIFLALILIFYHLRGFFIIGTDQSLIIKTFLQLAELSSTLAIDHI